MASAGAGGQAAQEEEDSTPGMITDAAPADVNSKRKIDWTSKWRTTRSTPRPSNASTSDMESTKRPEKWSMGVLNDRETDEVPGSILLLSKISKRNEPLGLQHVQRRDSSSSFPSPYPPSRAGSIPLRPQQTPEKKKTPDGKIVLEPQPDESLNDPLNWPKLRRDAALISLGFYCMLGGGMTPVLAAGFSDVATTFGVTVPRVALTTGLYMLGLGVGSVIASPTAILYGKRPVYLVASILFIITSVWCALSPNYASLVVARVFMGLAVSPVECLPSATVAEIFFLHERAYRLGIYTLLLLGGKNLIPLVSAAIINSLGWRWVFWIVAMVVGFGGILLFLFVPETFWDRTPRPHHKMKRPRLPSHMSMHSIFRAHSDQLDPTGQKNAANCTGDEKTDVDLQRPARAAGLAQRRLDQRRARFASVGDQDVEATPGSPVQDKVSDRSQEDFAYSEKPDRSVNTDLDAPRKALPEPVGDDVFGTTRAHQEASYFAEGEPPTANPDAAINALDLEQSLTPTTPVSAAAYTNRYRARPPKSYVETLRVFSGRLCHDNWLRVAIRPFILFAYPAILWSSTVYALSVGWLIVLSESVSTIYENRASYHFTPLQVGLVYLSPFIGGVLGTAVAGKLSDLIVRWISRRNGGIYEPEFRLVMAVPVALCTTIGLMGYGWAAAERDAWIVPTIFFGIISFGCCVGSTTAITFAVDSYRQYAGEALVTLNFSKNIFHGLVFSLFFNNWLQSDGSKTVFISLGGIQMFFLLFTIPMYIYGKRARMWTVRKNLMEKF